MATVPDDMGARKLAGRGLVSIDGPETRKFLQGLVTSDLGRLDRQPAIATALLTPQGKILVEMIVVRTPAGVLLDCHEAAVATLLKRLGLYKLRAKIDIADRTAELSVVWHPDHPGADGFADPRHPELGFRAFLPAAVAEGAANAAYDQRRIGLGIAEQGADFGETDVFPHEANYDRLGTIDFDKGCYVGQEVVSRMQHRGTARSRFVQVAGPAELPAKGTPVTAAAREIGRMGSHAGPHGLALVRLDRLADASAAGATPQAAGVPLTVTHQAWAQSDAAGTGRRETP